MVGGANGTAGRFGHFNDWSDSASRSTAGRASIATSRRTPAEAALAYLALVRRDTATAVRRFEELPDSLCPICYFERLTLAQLLSARHDDQKAAKLLDRWLIELLVPSQVHLDSGARPRGRAAG